jgi:PAS domain S-box-containing protein
VEWYSLSLLLLAAHTVAISLQPAVGTALFWTGRVMEYLGGAYLLMAAFSGRDEHGWNLSLANALRASEERYHQLFEFMTEGFALHELLADDRGRPCDYRFLSVNPAFERLTGLRAADLLGKQVREVLPVVEPYWLEHYGRVVATGEPARFENYSAALGRWYEVFAYRVAPRQFAATFTDVTERKTAEEALRRSETRFRGIFEHAPAGITIVGWEGRFQACNPAFGAMLGYGGEELRGMPFSSLIHPEDLEANLLETRRLKAGALHSFENESRYVRKDGAPIWVHKFVRLLPGETETPHVIAMVTDITERRRAEEALRESEQRLRLAQDAARAGTWEWNLQTQENVWSEEIWPLYGYAWPNGTVEPRVFEARVAPLDGPFAGRPAAVMLARDVTRQRLTEASLRQARKMEAVGQLTGGIAHDFNNLLAVILGNLELLAEQLRDEDAEMGDRVREALAAAERGAGLTHRLLIFSRRQPPRPQRTDLNRLVTGMGGLLRRSLGETVALQTRLAPDLFPTVIDPGQFETALLNLAVNARDAMPDGGQLTIETANYWLHEDAAHAALHGVAAGQYVALTVRDTGQGMTPDMQRRAFEPFFTTKGVGRGTGLGLSMVHGLVEQSGGFIHLHSKVGQGTTIHLHFPAAEVVDADVHAGASAELARSELGQRTILVVEDESAVRRLAVRTLESLGYQTVEADTAEAALAALEANPEVAALFTDVVLPGAASGVDLARQALQRRPNLKILFVSGYAEAHLSRFQDRPEGSDWLDKPYYKEQLVEKLRALLGDAPERSE